MVTTNYKRYVVNKLKKTKKVAWKNIMIGIDTRPCRVSVMLGDHTIKGYISPTETSLHCQARGECYFRFGGSLEQLLGLRVLFMTMGSIRANLV